MAVSTDTPTFVLVPGNGATSFMWNPVVRELARRGHRALPVELPGHGFEAVFPDGYQCPQDSAALATAPSLVAGLTLADYVARTLEDVRRTAGHGPVVLVGHSMGGSVVTGVANAAPELLARLVYVCAYCCVDSPNVPSYAPKPGEATELLDRARKSLWVGDARRTGTSRTNPRSGDPQVLATHHALMMADLDPALTPAVLNYALQPDESLRVIVADAQVDPAAWARLPRTYVRATGDEVLLPAVQDRMIAEADALSPANPFDVHSLAASHFVPITKPGELADILVTAAAPASR